MHTIVLNLFFAFQSGSAVMPILPYLWQWMRWICYGFGGLAGAVGAVSFIFGLWLGRPNLWRTGLISLLAGFGFVLVIPITRFVFTNWVQEAEEEVYIPEATTQFDKETLMKLERLLEGERGNRQPAETVSNRAPSDPPDGLKRLCFLERHGQLPPYLMLTSDPPEREAQASAVSEQAEREWPILARNLSLSEGRIVGKTPTGIVCQYGDTFLIFDLAALWRGMDFLEV